MSKNSKTKVTALVAFPEWVVGVTRTRQAGYLCWVINPELEVLNDGECYATSKEALASGRSLVLSSTGLQVDFSQCRLY